MELVGLWLGGGWYLLHFCLHLHPGGCCFDPNEYCFLMLDIARRLPGNKNFRELEAMVKICRPCLQISGPVLFVSKYFVSYIQSVFIEPF